MPDDLFTIEKSIPIPEKPFRKPSKIKYPFDQLEVGDSFLVPVNGERDNSITTENNLITSYLRWIYSNNSTFKFETRIVREGIRIWRIE